MKFDIKDVKSWATRHDVKVGDEGYFFHDIDILRGSESESLKPIKSVLFTLRNNYAKCFKIELGHDGDDVFEFFLPLNAVKEDKPKKYRPFKDMRELTEIVRGGGGEYNNLSVGDSLLIRRKGDEHYHQNILITSLVYGENDLISMNERSMQEWLDNFEFLAHCEGHSFGVQKK